jgi:hypothetical protein
MAEGVAQTEHLPSKQEAQCLILPKKSSSKRKKRKKGKRRRRRKRRREATLNKRSMLSQW